ncbi:MAG: hypothetical protein ACFE9S_18780 [Candidatus Hermodarchaeota archaeon]
MSNSSKASTIILILIGAVIIGFGSYYIINLQMQVNQLSGDSGVKNTWYTLLLDTFDVNDSYEPIDPLNTTIEVSTGEWVYISFTGNLKLDPSDLLRHSVGFFFAFDGALRAPGFVYEEILENAAQDDVEWIPVSFYAIFKDIDPGTYIISVYVAVLYNTCPAQIGGLNPNFGSALLIQTLIP